MADDLVRLVVLDSPCNAHHDVNLLRPIRPPLSIHIDTNRETFAQSPSRQPRKRKLAFVEIDYDPPRHPSPVRAKPTAILNTSGYPSPPATSAKLKSTVCLPPVDALPDTIDEQDIDLDLAGLGDIAHLTGMPESDPRAPPSPPPTLYTRAHDLPLDIVPFEFEFCASPGLPTPVSPVRDGGLWDDAPMSDASSRDEDEDDYDRSNGVWSCTPFLHLQDPEDTQELEMATDAPVRHPCDLLDYDRDFPPLPSLPLPSVPPIRGRVGRNGGDSLDAWSSGAPRVASSSRTPQPPAAPLPLPGLFVDPALVPLHEPTTVPLSPVMPSPSSTLVDNESQSMPKSDPSACLPLRQVHTAWPSHDEPPPPLDLQLNFDRPPDFRRTLHMSIPKRKAGSRPYPLPRDSMELRAEADADDLLLTPLSCDNRPLTTSPLEQPRSLLSSTDEGVDDRYAELEPMVIDSEPSITFRDPFALDDDATASLPLLSQPLFDDRIPCSPRQPALDILSSPRGARIDLPSLREDDDRARPDSPSRRSLSELPDLDLGFDVPTSASVPEPGPSSHSPSSRLLSLPGAETDDDLGLSSLHSPQVDDAPVPTTSSSSLGLFVPLAAAHDAPPAEQEEADLDLDFPPEAIAHVDPTELSHLLTLRRRAWFNERNAKRAELTAADTVRQLAGSVRLSPPVPGTLGEFEKERGPIEEVAGGSSSSGIRKKIQELERERAARRSQRKVWKERGREAQCLLKFVLGETIKERDAAAAVEDAMMVGTGKGKGKAKAKGSAKCAKSMAQLVARMVLKRREVARPLAGRVRPSEEKLDRIPSPLSMDLDDDDDVFDFDDLEGGFESGGEEDEDDDVYMKVEEGFSSEEVNGQTA